MQENTTTTEVSKLKISQRLCTPCSNTNYFSPDECRRVIDLSEELPLVDAKIGNTSNSNLENLVRQSEVKWLDPVEETLWIYHKVTAAVNQVNKEYKFDLSGIERIQVGRYTDGGFYDWHMDIGDGSPSLRKLSVTVQLSDGDDYEGGDLQFRSNRHYKPSRQQGSATIFPSFLLHRVTPVMKGIRWSLVAWIIGPPFK